MTNAAEYFDVTAAPMRMGRVRLKVRDLEAVSAFYQLVLGLSSVQTDDRCVTLGTGGVPLLELVGEPALVLHDRRQAGLFHTAFLMPSRADLARWLTHASTTGVPLQGAFDHIVSEAIYLTDPEGNGIEVYVDRLVSNWHGPNGEIRLASDPLDVQDLLKAAGGENWSGFPPGGIIGHEFRRRAYATCGAMGGPMVEIDMRRVYLKNIEIHGATQGTRRDFAAIREYAQSGAIKPLLAGTFPLADLGRAQEAFGRKDFVGKLVVTIDYPL